MIRYYNRDGEPITMELWAALFELRRDYGTVALDEIDDVCVSTVWLGLNTSGDPDGPPLIFETMVFMPTSTLCERYSTEAQALEGHRRHVEQIRGLVEDVNAVYHDE